MPTTEDKETICKDAGDMHLHEKVIYRNPNPRSKIGTITKEQSRSG